LGGKGEGEGLFIKEREGERKYPELLFHNFKELAFAHDLTCSGSYSSAEINVLFIFLHHPFSCLTHPGEIHTSQL
jgi:hypothetical protein